MGHLRLRESAEEDEHQDGGCIGGRPGVPSVRGQEGDRAGADGRDDDAVADPERIPVQSHHLADPQQPARRGRVRIPLSLRGGQRRQQPVEGVHRTESRVQVHGIQGRVRLARRAHGRTAEDRRRERTRAAGLPRKERRRVARRAPEHRRAEALGSECRGDEGQDRADSERSGVRADQGGPERSGSPGYDSRHSVESVHPAAENRAGGPAASGIAALREARPAPSGHVEGEAQRSKRRGADSGRDQQGRACAVERLSGGALPGAEPDARARSAEERCARPEPQGDRIRRPAAGCGQQPSDLRVAAAAHEGDRHLGRAQSEQHPDRRRGGAPAGAGQSGQAAQPAARHPWRIHHGRRPRVLLRILRQPDQVAGRNQGAPGPAVHRHDSQDGRGRRRVGAAARQGRDAELR